MLCLSSSTFCAISASDIPKSPTNCLALMRQSLAIFLAASAPSRPTIKMISRDRGFCTVILPLPFLVTVPILKTSSLAAVLYASAIICRSCENLAEPVGIPTADIGINFSLGVSSPRIIDVNWINFPEGVIAT